MHLSRQIAQNPLEIRQDSRASFAQFDEKSDGAIYAPDLIRASLGNKVKKAGKTLEFAGIIWDKAGYTKADTFSSVDVKAIHKVESVGRYWETAIFMLQGYMVK